MAKKGDRVFVALQCTDCRERNYYTQKNKKSDAQRIELNRFCSRCRTHKLHREVR